MQHNNNIVVIIPAYNPPQELVDFTKKLFDLGIKNIVVVNDGSLPNYKKIFDSLKTVVVNHTINMGKGRALKSAFNYCLNNFKNITGVVTADADGQHAIKDIVNIVRILDLKKRNLIIGAREFDKSIPFRSKFGNLITRKIFSLITGQKIKDTQSGLRGIPFEYLSKLISLPGEQYEYETNMLLHTKNFGISIKEIPIKTIYIDNNKSSHFNPIFDSLKIYFLIIRFMSSSLITVVIDYLAFLFIYILFKNLLFSIIGARIFASILNFNLNKKFVFKDKKSFLNQIIKYYLLFLFIMTTSFIMINGLNLYFGCGILIAKVISELFLFPFNFKFQRDFIFKVKE